MPKNWLIAFLLVSSTAALAQPESVSAQQVQWAGKVNAFCRIQTTVNGSLVTPSETTLTSVGAPTTGNFSFVTNSGGSKVGMTLPVLDKFTPSKLNPNVSAPSTKITEFSYVVTKGKTDQPKGSGTSDLSFNTSGPGSFAVDLNMTAVASEPLPAGDYNYSSTISCFAP